MSGGREVTVREAMDFARAESGRGRYDRAAEVLRQITRARPMHLPSKVERARILQRANRYDEAVAVLERAVAQVPTSGKVTFNFANALRNQGAKDAAIAAYRRAVRLEPENGEIHVGLGLALLQRGEWEEGFAEYEWRQSRLEFLDRMRRGGFTVWDGGDVAGRTIALLGEQGAGDALQFVRYASLLADRGARVVVHCHAPLRRLLASARGVHDVWQRHLGPFDGAELLMSLPMRFGTRPDSVPGEVPYLAAPAEAPVRLPSTGRLRVGLVWAGNPAHSRDHWRSIPFPALEPLLATERVDIYSLQRGAVVEHPRLTLLGGTLRDFADTAAIIEQLDLVIAVDTSVAHLAGALGKPVWLLLAQNPDWRWLTDRDDTPWYPTARLFRQERLGDWDGVVTRVAEALAAAA